MKKITFLFYLIIFGFIGLSCIWDRDTIAMERQRFPSTMEIISGKFLRHSPEFYQWRIQDREAKLKTNPNQWNYYDDLAVAYDKTGNHTKAIELMLQKEDLHPNQYETYANLGTFYIHNKQYREGLKYIDKAIAINANAHFGREVYQKYLVEYVLSKMKNGKVNLPLCQSPHPETNPNFYQFLLKTSEKTKMNPPKAAVKGILGMMKFGNFRSPILLEALGDLLRMSPKNVRQNASMLAFIAYQKAALEVNTIEVKTLYRKRYIFWSGSSGESSKAKVAKRKKTFADAIKSGDRFYNQIRSDEIRWIKAGKNPEEEFAKKYYKAPPKPTSSKKKPGLAEERQPKDTITKTTEKTSQKGISKTSQPTLPKKRETEKQATENKTRKESFPVIPVALVCLGGLLIGALIFQQRRRKS